MDVLPNEEEGKIRDSARAILEAECPPALVRKMEKDARGYDPVMWKKVSDLGWLAMALPEEHGGLGMPLVSLGIVMEEVGRAIAPLPLHSTLAAALTIARFGSYTQKSAVLPAVIKGDAILSWAFHERDARLLPEAVQLQARQTTDGWVLNGTKMFVDNFIVANRCLVACRTAPAAAGRSGLSLFLVDTSSPGIDHQSLVTLAKDKQSEVTFKDVCVPAENLIGNAHDAWPEIEQMLDYATVLLCAQMAGAARKDLEFAIDYAKHRTAFGQPLGAFQSISHVCADAIVGIDGCGLLTYEALWKMDQGLTAHVEVSQAKAFCNDKCQEAARNAQVIHGGIGFMMELDLHLWYRRIAAWTMRLGTAFEHRARVARALLDVPGPVRLGRPLPTDAPG